MKNKGFIINVLETVERPLAWGFVVIVILYILVILGLFGLIALYAVI